MAMFTPRESCSHRCVECDDKVLECTLSGNVAQTNKKRKKTNQNKILSAVLIV